MIKNEKQYKITQKHLLDTRNHIAEIESRKDITAKDRLILVSARLMERQFQQEIADYERLKKDRANVLKSRNLTELPSLIIEYKIMLGLTQKEFARKIGMKEQQLQRYEAEDFQGVSFSNLLKILKAIGLEITLKDTLIHEES